MLVRVLCSVLYKTCEGPPQAQQELPNVLSAKDAKGPAQLGDTSRGERWLRTSGCCVRCILHKGYAKREHTMTKAFV